ncbi:hypothetical protein MG293_000596 [Ovis ammon polii]|nr:hypothetical protein MG293_000596 [Ovis ammon polii]
MSLNKLSLLVDFENVGNLGISGTSHLQTCSALQEKRESLVFRVSAGPEQIGCCPPTLGRAIYFTETSDSNADLFRKHLADPLIWAFPDALRETRFLFPATEIYQWLYDILPFQKNCHKQHVDTGASSVRNTISETQIHLGLTLEAYQYNQVRVAQVFGEHGYCDLSPFPAAQFSGCTAGSPSQVDGDCPEPQEVLAKKPACSLLSFYGNGQFIQLLVILISSSVKWGQDDLLESAKRTEENDTGMVQKLDQKLPVANEYLLLSGGVREGVVDLDLDELNVYARGTDYDMDFTLLVPALKLHDRNQPVTLDMRHSALCHSWLSLRLFDEGTISKWKDCCTIVDHINGATNYFFSPTKVADWFYDSISIVLSEIQKKPQRGMPKVEKVEKNGTIISIILGVGSSRMLYDIVPVVSFKGWPAVAQSWLMENHFWDGKITEEEVISGFYLVPACSYKGKKDNEWRLSFARSEVQLKKCISSSLMQAYQACKAIIIKLLSRPKAISPYHLRSMMLWACDRLPANYLAQEDYAAHFLLGLIDDLQHCLVNKMCPNYFIPQCNMLEHLSEETVMLHARKLSSVRSDPAEHLRTAIEHVKAANRLTLELQRRGSTTSIPSPQSDGGDPNQPDDRLAKKLQQLVTENPGKSISVFINPDDVTRPHFRIDDKFF